MWDNLTIDGFSFSGAREYEEAKRDSDTIKCICAKMDVNNPEISLKVYNKLLEKNTLHSIVGISFLKSMRDNVIRSGILLDEEIRPLNAPLLNPAESMSVMGDESALENDSLISEAASDIEDHISDNSDTEEAREKRIKSREEAELGKKAKQYKEVADYYRDKVKRLTIIMIAMVAVIIFLFIVAIKNKNLNLTTEEIAVQDKYAEWAEELEAREKAVTERENALN